MDCSIACRKKTACTLDSLGEGMYSIIIRANGLDEEVAVSYRKPELAFGSSERGPNMSEVGIFKVFIPGGSQ